MVAAGGAPFEVIESSEEFYGLEAVANVCSEQIPSAFIFALLVVGEAFVRVIEIWIYVSVCVIGVDFCAGVEVECVCEVSVDEQADGRGVVVMCFRFGKVCYDDGI